MIFSEHISFILTDSALITVQEVEGDVFDPVREKIRKGIGKIRRKQSAYLMYSLLDAIVDNYFLIIEQIGEDLEELEEQILNNPSENAINDIHHFKRQVIILRKAVWPLREVVNGILREESGLMDDTTELYFKDLYGNIVQVIENVEMHRDLISGLQDLCLSSISNKMNNVMKTLTIIATIFIPLTFVAGVYGMNFEFMPELHWKYGYPAIWTFMILATAGMVAYFKRVKWM